MNRNLLIGLLIFSFALEVASYFFLRSMYYNGDIPNVHNYIKLFSLFSVMFKSVFYIIIIIYQGYQKRFLFYSIFSILTLISFYFFYTYFMEFNQSNSIFADLSFVFGVAGLVVAIYIAVDPSTRGFVKSILIINSLLLLIYRTPVYLFVQTMAMVFFGTTYDEYYIVLSYMIYLQYFVFGIWTIFQSLIIKKIDYI